MEGVSDTTSSSGDNSYFYNADTSKGSSVSSGMQEEYNELLKYAVVAPKWNSQVTKPDVKFPQLSLLGTNQSLQTTVNYFEDGVSSTNKSDTLQSLTEAQDNQHNASDEDDRDSAMGSEEINTGRKTFRENQLSPPIPDKTVVSSMQEFIPSKLKQSATIFQDISEENELNVDSMKLLSILHKSNETSNNLIMTEFNNLKSNMEENLRRQLFKEQNDHKNEINDLQNELENMKELLHTYENSLMRKDSVISNLTKAVHTYKVKQDMLKVLTHWKLRSVNEKRQSFTSKLAKRSRERQLTRQTWQAWRLLVENRWKIRVEKTCQSKAQKVCEQLTQDYEEKLASANIATDEYKHEVERLRQEREKYEGSMKKAFIRGVCALNLEARNMFSGTEAALDQNEELISETTVEALSEVPEKPLYAPRTKHFKQVKDTDTVTPGILKEHVISQVTKPENSYPKQMLHVAKSNSLNTATGIKARPLQSKVTGCGCQRSKSPGMRSTGVLVKRHHPNVENASTKHQLSYVKKYPNTKAPAIE